MATTALRLQPIRSAMSAVLISVVESKKTIRRISSGLNARPLLAISSSPKPVSPTALQKQTEGQKQSDRSGIVGYYSGDGKPIRMWDLSAVPIGLSLTN